MTTIASLKQVFDFQFDSLANDLQNIEVIINGKDKL